MYKINKCILLGRNVPRGSLVRYVGCGDKCPPSYECKRPKPPQWEQEIEEQRRMYTPRLFEKECHGNPKLYKNLFYFICVPTLLCVLVNHVFFAEEVKRPKFMEFSHMRIRRKEYPWDPVRTLFHNPKVNALPTGYETEVPEEDEVDPFEIRK